MSKEHKIVVTRDNTKSGYIVLWKIEALNKLSVCQKDKPKLHHKKGQWHPITDRETIGDICSIGAARECLGFIPYKDCMQVLIIKRAK